MGTYGHGPQVKEFPLVDFGPDLALDSSSKGQIVLLDMDKGVPTTKGYQAMNSPQPMITSPLPSMSLGATVVYYSNGFIQVFAGDTNHLYYLPAGAQPPVQGGPWGIAEAAGAIPTAVGSRWRYAQFGDTVITVNAGQAQPLYSTFNGGGNFQPVATSPGAVGSPPANADLVTAVNGQVLMFQGSNWYCSALSTFNDWTPDIQTQSGSGVLYDFPGSIVACSRLFRSVIAFKASATWVGSYIGGQAVWQWQLISDLTGTWCQEAVIEMPDAVAFFGIDDFYLTSGYTPQRIPNSLKEWFFDVADQTLFGAMLSRYDPYHAICFWYFVSKNTPYAEVPDRYVCWNSRTGKWGAGYLNVTMVPYPNFQPGSNPGSSLSGGLWNGLYFGTDNILYSWSGAPGNMMLKTSYVGTVQAYSQCMRVKPLYYIKPEHTVIQPYHVHNVGDPDIAGPPTFLSPDGWHYFRQYDKWHSFQINIDGPGTPMMPNTQHGGEISALLIDLRPGGWR